MDQSLSIIVPVHNAQATLASQIGHLLEVVSDLAPDFEILVVDDASTDQTEEVAIDFARRYPQVRVAHHAQRRGTAAAVKTGLLHTSGDVVFVHHESGCLSPSALRNLWQRRHDEQLLTAQAENPARPLESGRIHRLTAWGAALGKPGAPMEPLGRTRSGAEWRSSSAAERPRSAR